MAMRTANEPKRDLERVAGVADAAADLVDSVDQVEHDHRADVAAGARDLRVRMHGVTERARRCRRKRWLRLHSD